jgi:hypothetical protein
MSRAKQITAILGGALLALTFTTQPSSAAVNAAPSPGASGQLVVQTDNTADLSARFETSAATASVVGRKASPTRDVVEIAVGSTKITADRDLATGKATWSMGGATMTDRDRATLASMVSATSAWRTSGATDKTTGATKQSGGLKDLASRLLMLSAEAPSGVAIGTQTVDRPSERRLEKSAGSISVVIDAKASKADSCVADVVATTTAETAERAAAVAACQQSNEDGILYFGSCSTTTRWLMHDAAGHCMVGESITAGPRSSECMGECGPGCNGLNIYTYDCGDHDRCGRVHGGSTNPWDSECGDEYFEADDDFIWGWPNCT